MVKQFPTFLNREVGNQNIFLDAHVYKRVRHAVEADEVSQ